MNKRWIVWFSLSLLLMSCGESPEQKNSLVIPIDLKADASDAVSPMATEPDAAFEIYLDISHPMGGYIPTDDSTGDFATSYVTLVQAMTERGNAGTSIVRMTLDSNLSDPIKAPIREFQFNHADMMGSSSNLQAAFNRIEGQAMLGKLKAAVLISDFVYTGDSDGAQALSQKLSTMPEVVSGELEYGIFGIKMPYFGVIKRNTPGCDRFVRKFGCWFSENNSRLSKPSWTPIKNNVNRPLYFFIVGTNLNAVAKHLKETIPACGDERCAWEHLSAREQSKQAPLTCSWKPTDSLYVVGLKPTCRRPNESTNVSCTLILPNYAFSLKITEVISKKSQQDAINANATKTEDASISFSYQCGKNYELDVVASQTAASEFATWSANDDFYVATLDKTLGLNSFLSHIRTSSKLSGSTLIFENPASQETPAP